MRIGGGVGAGSGVKWRLTGVAEASAASGWMSVGRLAGALVLAPSVVSSSSASTAATWIRFAGVGGSTSGAPSSTEASVGADAHGERNRRGGGVGGGSGVRRIVLALSSTSSPPFANRFSVRAQSALSNGRFCVVASSSSIESDDANLGNATCDGVGIESIALGGGVITRRRGFRRRSSEDDGGDDDSLGSARLALHQNSRRLTAPT